MNESTLLIADRVEANAKVAWNLKTAAEMMGMSYRSLRREIIRRKIVPTPTLGLITREEALRYLREEVQLARKRKRFDKPKPQIPPPDDAGKPLHCDQTSPPILQRERSPNQP